MPRLCPGWTQGGRGGRPGFASPGPRHAPDYSFPLKYPVGRLEPFLAVLGASCLFLGVVLVSGEDGPFAVGVELGRDLYHLYARAAQTAHYLLEGGAYGWT